jgi:hypothetical protein
VAATTHCACIDGVVATFVQQALLRAGFGALERNTSVEHNRAGLGALERNTSVEHNRAGLGALESVWVLGHWSIA